ncbi:MAG: ABC transporter ATP-binding protein [Actinomycetota bacterium]
MPTLEAQRLTLGYGPVTVIDDLSVDVPPGEITAVIGANGCGKSTLLRALARLLRPSGGAVLLDGKEIHRYPSKKVAQRLGLLPQSPRAPDGISVADLARRGRYPHQKLFEQWSADDEQAVQRAIELTGTQELAARPIDELSGGQRQRAWIAMTLAQETPMLLLDEPTTFLDIAHQVEVLDLLRRLNRTEGRTVVMVLHDLNHACRYATHLVALADGVIAAQGRPVEVITPELVSEVFGLDVVVIDDPVTGGPLCVPKVDGWADQP